MEKTKLIIEIDKFFSEAYNFCNRRNSCTVPITCEYYGFCSNFLHNNMSNASAMFYYYVLDNNYDFPSYNYFRHQLNGSHYYMYEASCDLARRFWYLQRRFYRSKKSQRYMKAQKILDYIG